MGGGAGVSWSAVSEVRPKYQEVCGEVGCCGAGGMDNAGADRGEQAAARSRLAPLPPQMAPTWVPKPEATPMRGKPRLPARPRRAVDDAPPGGRRRGERRHAGVAGAPEVAASKNMVEAS